MSEHLILTSSMFPSTTPLQTNLNLVQLSSISRDRAFFQTSDELQAFKTGKRLVIQQSGKIAKPTMSVPFCCTYDQVYETIIDLLNRTNTQVGAVLKQEQQQSTAANSSSLNWPPNADLTGMIRAYIEELEVSKCCSTGQFKQKLTLE